MSSIILKYETLSLYLPQEKICEIDIEKQDILADMVFKFQALAGAKKTDLLTLEFHLLRNYYPELTMRDVQLAFEYAAVGKLKNWGVTRKTIREDVCEVMNAYQSYILDSKNQHIITQEDLEVIAKKDKEAQDKLLKQYEQFVRGEKEIDLYGIPAMRSADVWDAVVKLGVAEDFELENEKDYLQAWIHTLHIKQQFVKPQTYREILKMWANGEVHESLRGLASHEIKAKKLLLVVEKRREN